MNDKLTEIINNEKEILSTLPTDNKKQKNKYIAKCNEFKESSNALLERINQEVEERYNKYNIYTVNPKIKEIEDYLKIFTNNFYLLSKSNTSFEKSELDKITFNISKYYRSSLDDVNTCILNGIYAFKKVGIELTCNDFSYSRFAFEYMKAFIDNINDLSKQILKDTFNKVYWQCSDIITHIELNFKYLYYKNQKKFDEYYKKHAINFVNGNTYEEVYRRYNELVKNKDLLISKDISIIIDKFKKREFIPTDFKEEKLDKFYLEQSNELLNSFKESILEYRDYLKVTYIIDYFKKLYAEKDKYKNISKPIFNEIKKNEGKLFGLNKKITGLQKKNKDISLIDVEVDKTILLLKEKYDELTDALFKERILSNFSESSTYYDILEFMYNNYVPFVMMIKSTDEELTYEEIDNNINEVNRILLNPYLSLFNNVCINDTKDIKFIISDAYSLSKFDVKPENFENEGDLDNILNMLNRVIVYHNLNEENVLVENIKFICDIEDQKNKE